MFLIRLSNDDNYAESCLLWNKSYFCTPRLQEMHLIRTLVLRLHSHAVIG